MNYLMGRLKWILVSSDIWEYIKFKQNKTEQFSLKSVIFFNVFIKNLKYQSYVHQIFINGFENNGWLDVVRRPSI